MSDTPDTIPSVDKTDKKSVGLRVTRVPHPWNPPRQKRTVDIKIEPCQVSDCNTCVKINNAINFQDTTDNTNYVVDEDQVPQNNNIIVQQQSSRESPASTKGIVYSILWAKASSRKNKKWEHDGYLIIDGNSLTLKDDVGKVLEFSTNYKLPDVLESGTILKLGGREVQLQDLCDDPFVKKQKRDDEKLKVVPLQNDTARSTSGSQKSFDVNKVSFRPPQSEGQGSNVIDPSQQSTSGSLNDKTYTVLWARASMKKNKTWEHDGLLIINGNNFTLKDTKGKVLDSSTNYKFPDVLESGTVLKFGGREIQLQDLCQTSVVEHQNDEGLDDESLKRLLLKQKKPTSAITKPFIKPFAPGTFEPIIRGNRDTARPLFDVDAPGAFILPEPEWDHQRIYNHQNLPMVPVVVDPHVARHLRPHQREGVEFLYRSVYLPPTKFGGAILADDMGLGKTLQCIALLWTLHKQGPYERKPIVSRSLIVTPSSLVQNWEKEFNYWLGKERIRVYSVNSTNTLDKCPGQCTVIIISYEMAIRSEAVLKSKKIDLMICDEAHKIKNVKNKAYQLLKSLLCTRRILLTGTPVQNDLMELFSLVDFVRPGALGTDSDFRSEYAIPIAKFQEDTASRSVKTMGMVTAEKLNAEISPYFLRRDATVMLKYLPDRVTQIVFCNPSPLQAELYTAVMNSDAAMNCLSGSCQSPLAVILLLKKLCNHPSLVHAKNQTDSSTSAKIYGELLKAFPSTYNHQSTSTADSGKLSVLVQMLTKFQNDRHKVVLVSHYTKTLNVLESMCKARGFPIVRLDGSTIAKERIGIVEKFNASKESLIFLLSSKAGGVGLNLQSASKIVLYDIDWNPAHDVQAMARCWRPGQKKETFIYRLLTCGTIEEKIYQRQISKQDVSGSVIDLLLSNSIKFSPEDLKDIFTFHEKGCLTHELMGCECEGDGRNLVQDTETEDDKQQPPRKKRKIEGMGELMQWEHFGQPFQNYDVDEALIHKSVEFIFRNKSAVTSSDEDVPYPEDEDKGDEMWEGDEDIDFSELMDIEVEVDEI